MTDQGLYAVHVRLSRPEDDEPPTSISVILHVSVGLTEDSDDDAERAERAAVDVFRPLLGNSTHIVAMAVQVR